MIRDSIALCNQCYKAAIHEDQRVLVLGNIVKHVKCEPSSAISPSAHAAVEKARKVPPLGVAVAPEEPLKASTTCATDGPAAVEDIRAARLKEVPAQAGKPKFRATPSASKS